MKCSRCERTAVFENRPSKEGLCKMHFMNSVEKRFKMEIRSQILFKKENNVISVAISGGKDSSVLLYLLNKVLGKKKNVTLNALTIDEGIEGYRSNGLDSAIFLCSSLGIQHRIISFREAYNTEMDLVVKNEKLEGSPCAYCGPMRRDLMNRMSTEVNADYVALGINLDDYSQSILMNVMRGDFDKMLRMAPHNRKVEGLVPRIVPLRRIYEKEIKLYAILAEIPHDTGWCPYAMKAQRNLARDLLNNMEEHQPGTKLAIEKFLERLKNDHTQSDSITLAEKCTICGNPSNGKYCQACIRSGRINMENKN